MIKEILKVYLEQRELQTNPETLEKFEIYYNMISMRNKEINLVANADPEEIVVRHFLDSLSIIGQLKEGNVSAIDVGTGAGFPGIPLKIFRPDIEMTLVDSMGKRVEFLKDVSGELGLTKIHIIQGRAEEAANYVRYRDTFDYSLSRAVAKMNVLIELCLPFVKVGGAFIAMKSSRSDEELVECRNAIDKLGGRQGEIFEYELPVSGAAMRAIRIDKIAPTPNGYPRKFASIKNKPL